MHFRILHSISYCADREKNNAMKIVKNTLIWGIYIHQNIFKFNHIVCLL